jgi:hypothetical protein
VSDDLEVVAEEDVTEAPTSGLPWRGFAAVASLVIAGALVVISVDNHRLAAQGARRECVERSNAAAQLEQFDEPDGRSSQRLSAERYASCYGLAKAPPTSPATTVLPHVVRRCPDSEHPFEGPPVPGESGDGLPPSGSATRDAAERAAARRSPESNARVVAVDGRAWSRTRDGQVEIRNEVLYVVEVELPSEQQCPGGPDFFDGAPMRFVYRL